MITNILILFFTGLIRTVFAILPRSEGLPTGFATAISYVFSEAYKYNWLVPIGTILQVFAIIVGFEIGFLLFKLIMGGVNLLRGRQSTTV